MDFDSDSLKLRLKVSFPADIAHISEVVDAIMKIITAMDCARGHEDDIELSLREALANAIKHGAGGDAAKQVACSVGCEEEHGMLIVVSDPGDGFDLEKVADPLQGENIYSDHGRGIFLINRFMDHVEYKRGGTEIHMRKFTKNAADAGQKSCGMKEGVI